MFLCKRFLLTVVSVSWLTTSLFAQKDPPPTPLQLPALSREKTPAPLTDKSVTSPAENAQPKTTAANPQPLQLPPGVKAERDLAYVENGHERQKLDVYLPSEVKEGAKPLPLIVWIHGGGWTGGNKERPPAVRFVNEGYAVASINYRLSQHAIYPAQIEDCKTAIRWLRANAKKYNFDPEHVGVWGASAGGHLVALLGTTAEAKELEGKGANLDQSSRVQCVVDWFGPTDFTVIGDMAENPNSPVCKLLGGTVKEHKQLAEQASPAKFVNKNSAPFLIQHGDKDPLVPIAQSEELEEYLKKAGVEVTLQKIAGAGHGFGNKESEIAPPIKAFFEKHLKNEK